MTWGKHLWGERHDERRPRQTRRGPGIDMIVDAAGRSAHATSGSGGVRTRARRVRTHADTALRQLCGNSGLSTLDQRLSCFFQGLQSHFARDSGEPL